MPTPDVLARGARKEDQLKGKSASVTIFMAPADQLREGSPAEKVFIPEALDTYLYTLVTRHSFRKK